MLILILLFILDPLEFKFSLIINEFLFPGILDPLLILLLLLFKLFLSNCPSFIFLILSCSASKTSKAVTILFL